MFIDYNHNSGLDVPVINTVARFEVFQIRRYLTGLLTSFVLIPIFFLIYVLFGRPVGWAVIGLFFASLVLYVLFATTRGIVRLVHRAYSDRRSSAAERAGWNQMSRPLR